MNEQWTCEICELLFEPLLTPSLTPRHYRGTGSTPNGRRFSGTTIRAWRKDRSTLHIPPTFLIEASLDAPLTTLQLTAFDHKILRRRLTQILTMNTPPLHHRIATRSPPL